MGAEVNGMTDLQYKGMLLDQQQVWTDLLAFAEKAEKTEIMARIESQLKLIHRKLILR